MKKFKKILVTTDLSDASITAMEYAVWLSTKEKASITLLYCVENLPAVAYHTVDLTYDKFRNQILEEEDNRLHEFAKKLHRLFHKKVKIILSEGNAALSIVQYSNDNNIDMIVMNTHGRIGIQHAFLGSVAEKVVRTALCPVLTVKSGSAKIRLSKRKLRPTK